MPPKASTSTPARLSPQEVPVVFQRYRTELQNLAQKIGELESEMEEHALVLSTLQPLSKTAPTRPCYRLIGGVLVQRTVQDVVPALETNYGGIKEVLESLVRSYKGKEEEFERFRGEYDIRVSTYSLPIPRPQSQELLLLDQACCSF
ncbi:Prefoldin [Naematelia encephala]|uniref:Prefoldin n=1 Tax=Naematelia encephala TaxID=71784 RepID=A0A1Y2AL65_9TREE|nr:Prefoldin [Naematelia encephala]